MEESELKKLIKMLKRLVSNYQARIYKPKIGDLIYKPKIGEYRQNPSKHIMHHDFKYQPEPKPKIPEDKPSSYKGYPWTEPINYKPEKERLVYDPEVKQLLRSIDEHLAKSESKAKVSDENLNPELVEETSEFETESLERNEMNSPKNEESFEDYRMENGLEQVEKIEVEENDEKIIEPKEDLAQTEVETLGTVEEIIPEESAIQELEAEDLSSLEAELFPEPTEPIERVEPVQEGEY